MAGTLRLALVLVLTGFATERARSSQVVWFSQALSAHQTSEGQALDDTFIFELGAFTSGFVPALSNTELWAENWVAASRSSYNTQTQVFGGTHTLPSNEAPFEQTSRGYIWGFSPAAPTEWILISNPAWLWPDASNPIAFPENWSVAQATEVLLGMVDVSSGAPFFLKMGTVTDSPLPLLDPNVWLASHFTPEQLADETVSGWQEDPDGDDLTNLLEMTFNTDPQVADREGLPVPSLLARDGHEYLQLSVDKIPSVPVEYTVEVSLDRVTWSRGDPHTEILVDTPSKLVVRSQSAIGFLDRQFMRLLVELEE